MSHESDPNALVAKDGSNIMVIVHRNESELRQAAAVTLHALTCIPEDVRMGNYDVDFRSIQGQDGTEILTQLRRCTTTVVIQLLGSGKGFVDPGGAGSARYSHLEISRCQPQIDGMVSSATGTCHGCRQ